jgi:hypothetical protein
MTRDIMSPFASFKEDPLSSESYREGGIREIYIWKAGGGCWTEE